MDKSLHYLAMANQQMIQKQLLERVKSARAYAGTAENSGFSERS